MNIQTTTTSTDFGRSFIFVAALPKSASSLMWLIVSALQEECGRADPGKMPLTCRRFLPLQFELMDTFRRGGVFSGHAPLTFDTNLFLRATRCRYIVHLRHPADFIVALYCHGADGRLARFVPPHVLDRLSFAPAEDERWIYALSAIDASIFDKDRSDPDEAIAHLLRDGPLFKAMAWMCDWLAYRDPNLSSVSTYEALMSGFDPAIDRLSHFVRGRPVDNYVMDYLKHVVNYEAERSKTKDRKRYPKGWTGEVGIWKRYFTQNDVSLYNKAVRRFLAYYPNAHTLSFPSTKTSRSDKTIPHDETSTERLRLVSGTLGISCSVFAHGRRSPVLSDRLVRHLHHRLFRRHQRTR